MSLLIVVHVNSLSSPFANKTQLTISPPTPMKTVTGTPVGSRLSEDQDTLGPTQGLMSGVWGGDFAVETFHDPK